MVGKNIRNYINLIYSILGGTGGDNIRAGEEITKLDSSHNSIIFNAIVENVRF